MHHQPVGDQRDEVFVSQAGTLLSGEAPPDPQSSDSSSSSSEDDDRMDLSSMTRYGDSTVKSQGPCHTPPSAPVASLGSSR